MTRRLNTANAPRSRQASIGACPLSVKPRATSNNRLPWSAWTITTRLAVLWATLVLGAALGAPPWASTAAAATGGYPYASYNGRGSNPSQYEWADSSGRFISSYGYYYRNCTDFSAWKLAAANGFGNYRGLGNASTWGVRARDRGHKVDMKPKPGSIAWWGPNGGMGKWGHVAWVEAVKGDKVTIQEYNNARRGSYGRRTISRTSVSGYIHFKDLNTLAGASPLGHFERVEGLSDNRIRVTGWAFDPDGATRPVQVEAWIDGKRGQAGARKVPLGYASVTRNDVARAHKGAGAQHGFRTIITGVAPGSHPVRVYALNRFAGGDTKYLGGKTIRVPEPVTDDPVDTDPLTDDPVADDPLEDDPVDTDPAPPVFRQSEYTWAGGDHFQSFMGDFNGDSQVDVGLRRISDGTFYWRLGPTFNQFTTTWSTGAGAEYQSFMGDFNGDNQVDIGLRRISSGTFYWRLGPTFDQFTTTWSTGAGAEYQSFMGDFNGDNQVDIGLRRISSGMFYWRLGPTFSQFTTTWSAGAGAEYQSFMGDFNGDNQVDVGLRRTTDGTFYWRLGPSFSQGLHNWSAAVGDKYQSFMGDFNGDSQVDVGVRRTTDGTFYWRLQTPP